MTRATGKTVSYPTELSWLIFAYYELDFTVIVCYLYLDKNECSLVRGICGTTDCINTEGSYYCTCRFKFGRFDAKTLSCRGL